MSEQIITILKRRLDDLVAYGKVDVETRRNALKEELQFYILNFIYHHPEYSKWTMYGGSALRIIHGLNRMSVDLDFEIPHAITEKFLEGLKIEIKKYFKDTYGADSNFLTIKITTGRGLLLKFHVGEEISLGHPSKQVHVKIDLNHFFAPKTVHERRPINRDQLSFVIVVYNMSALMASKIAAIFLRGTRGVGEDVYSEKGRDIYDLLWYMNKKVIPDFDYLKAKNVEEAKELRILFNKLTIQMNKVSDSNLKQDLSPLFEDRTYIENWLSNWRESYFQLLEDYKIHTVTNLKKMTTSNNLLNDVLSFAYWYDAEGEKMVRFTYYISDYWIQFRNGDISVEPSQKIKEFFEYSTNGSASSPPSQDKLIQYAEMFYQKTENYLKKTNRIILGDTFNTKVIRMTADNLNQKEHILLNKSALLYSELDDLLK